jgi:6-phosphogluconolactonase (cycloisomerase 2 family)
VREDLVYFGTYTDPDRQASWKVSPERPFMGLKGKTGGRLLLVSNRGYDSIAVFAVDPESGDSSG